MKKIIFLLMLLMFIPSVNALNVIIDSPENITYSTTSIDLNWSANETVLDAWYSLNGGSNISLLNTVSFSETPDSAFNDVGTNVLTAVSTDDSNYATLEVSGGDTVDYIESNWNDANIPIGSSINSVLYSIKHYESTTNEADLTIQWNGTGSWSQVCDINENLGETTDVCNLTSYIDTVTEANNIYLRYRLERISGTEYTYLNYEYLEINYTDVINTTIIASEGSNNVIVYANDTTGNIDSATQYFTVDTQPPNCTFISQTPSELNSTSKGKITILYNCTDATGINNTRIGLAHTVNYTIENNLNYSWRFPSNTLAGGLHSEQRAEYRNESKWFESLFYNIYEWGFHAIGLDGKYIVISDSGTYIDGFWYLANLTRSELRGIYHIDFPLDKSNMESSAMKSINVHQNNIVISEIHLRDIKANTTTQLDIYSEDTNAPQDKLIYYCNLTKKTDGLTIKVSPNCVYIGAINRNDAYSYTIANASYYQLGGYIDADKKVGGVVVTEISYIAELSNAPLINAWKSKYSDDIALVGNISLNNTGMLYTSSDNGVSFIQHNGTRVMWSSRIHEDIDEVTYKVYSCDNVSTNNCGWSILQKYPIGILPQAPETPHITHIDGDENLNGTYTGVFNIGGFLGLDPNGDFVTGNLTLRNTDGTFNYIINGSFSDSNKEINVSFDSTLVLNGEYKLNLENCDPTFLCSSTLMYENFTLNDTTPPQNILNLLPYDTDHTNDNRTNFTWDVDYEPNLSFDLVILNATDNSTVLNKTGITNQYYALILSEELEDYEYYWYIIAYDLNQNFVKSDEFYLVIDTIIPDITLFDYPKFDNSTIVGGNITLDTAFDDTYLFAIQSNITNSTGALFWNKTEINLTTDNYILNDTIDISTWASGTYTITLYAEDDHTVNELPDYDVSKILLYDKIKFDTYDNEINIFFDKDGGTKEKLLTYDFEKLTDRYTFNYLFDDKTGLEKTYVFFVESQEKIFYREDLYTYPSFVTGDNWIDFNLDVDALYFVEKQTDYTYMVTIVTMASDLYFNSLGGLNNVTEIYTFEVDNSAPILSFVSPTPLNDSIMWYTDQTIVIQSDESLLDGTVILEIDGSANYTMIKINDTAYTYDFNFTNGSHTFQVYAFDIYNNSGISELRNFVIDLTTPPQFIISSPLNITYNALSIDLEIINLGRPVTEWYYSVDYANWSLFTPNTSLIGFEYNDIYQLDVLAISNAILNSTETVIFSINYTGASYSQNLSCSSSDMHYISINPLDDDDVRWSCELDTDESYYCITHVYGNDEFNQKDEQKLIQTNPKRTTVKRYGVVDYFKSTGSYANVYFTDERLMAESNYTYEVECISESGKDYGFFTKPVTIEYRQFNNSLALSVFSIENMGYLFGLFFLIFIGLFIFFRGVKRA